MSQIRTDKINGIAKSYDPISIQGEKEGELLVVGWGGTYGAISSATKALQDEGFALSCINLRHLNPLPNDLEALLSSFKKVIVPELNLGQLSTILKAKYIKDIISFNKLQGKPFKVSELRKEFVNHLSSN